MSENFALYSQTLDTLPLSEMKALAPGAATAFGMTERGMTYTYSWPDLKIICSVMDRNSIPSHLQGFCGYIHHIYEGNLDKRGRAIIAQIEKTKLILGVELQPERDHQSRWSDVIEKLCAGLDPFVFFQNSIFDCNNRLVLGPDKSFDPTAVLVPPTSPAKNETLNPNQFGTPSQIARLNRSKSILLKKKCRCIMGHCS